MKVQLLLEVDFRDIEPGIELEFVDKWPALEAAIDNRLGGYRVRILGTRRMGIARVLTSVKRSIDVRVFQQSPIVWGGDPEL